MEFKFKMHILRNIFIIITIIVAIVTITAGTVIYTRTEPVKKDQQYSNQTIGILIYCSGIVLFVISLAITMSFAESK